MSPPWLHLALRSLVRVSQREATVRPRWPRLASSRVARSGELLKQSHSVSFLSSARGRDARFLPSRERRHAFVVTTHITTVRAVAAMAQWAFVAGWRSANPSRPRRRESFCLQEA